MTYFNHPNRRRVIGSEELPEGYELLTAKEYAEKHSYSTDTVSKKCRCKKLKAYKNSGQWFIVDKKD